MFQSGGEDNPVGHHQRLAFQLGLPRKNHRSAIVLVTGRRLLQAWTALRGRLAFKSLTKFAPRDYTGKKGLRIGRLDPLLDYGFRRLTSTKLGKHVGIDEIPVYRSMGRP